MKFIYQDNKDGGKILFETEATDILVADAEFKKATGIDPEKAPHIGVKLLDIQT